MEEKGGEGRKGGEETTEKCRGPHRRCRVAEEAPLWTLLLPPLIHQPPPCSFHRYPSQLPHAASFLTRSLHAKIPEKPHGTHSRAPHETLAITAHRVRCWVRFPAHYTRLFYLPDDCNSCMGPTQGKEQKLISGRSPLSVRLARKYQLKHRVQL